MLNHIANSLCRLINYFRRVKFALLANTHGLHFKIYGRVFVENYRNLYIGKGVTINEGVYINCRDIVRIGNNVRISAGVKIVTTGLNESRVHFQKPISIGDSCWLGVNSIILPGITLAEEVVVAASAVVTKSVLVRGTKVLGIPAREKGK